MYLRALLAAVIFTVSPLTSVQAAGHESPEEIQARFDEAFDALNTERVYTARRLLRELLADYPTLHRARLELARADYLARDFDAAEAEIRRVLEDPEVPPSVRTTLLAFLAQIRDDRRVFEERHKWSGSFYGGVMYDSNVNFGINRDIVDLGGTIFTVNPLSQEIDDWAGVIDAGLLHTYNPGVTFRSGENTGFFLWQTQGNGYYRYYLDEDDFNLGVLTLRTGPAWVVPDEWRASVGLQADQVFYDGGKLAFFTTLNPEYTWVVDERTEVSVYGAWTRRDYDATEDAGRDGDQLIGGVEATRLYDDDKLGLQAGLSWVDFDADNDIFGYSGPDIWAGAAYEAWERGSVYGRIGYREFNYDGPWPIPGLGALARDDDEWRFIAGFRHQYNRGILDDWVLPRASNCSITTVTR